jgi:hypothetical protein
MSDLLSLLVEPLQLSFMRNAMVAIVLVGIACGAIGVFVTLRGLAFMGDAIAHAVFPGLVIAYVLGGNFLIGALIAATLVSLAIGFVTQSTLLRNDTAIGVFFVGAFALGVAIISTQRSYARDVTSFLFGSILGVSYGDLLLTGAGRRGRPGHALALPQGAGSRQFRPHLRPRAGAQPLALGSTVPVAAGHDGGDFAANGGECAPAGHAGHALRDRAPAHRPPRPDDRRLSGARRALGDHRSLYLVLPRRVVRRQHRPGRTGIFIVVFLFAPRTGAITTRIARRLHYHHPERDQFAEGT